MNPNDTDLCYLGATEALDLFARRALSPVELLDAQIDRIGQVEPALNAVRAERFEQARAQARVAEAKYAAGAPTGALEGLPTALKNEHGMAGEFTDVGSNLLGREPDAENAPITQRLVDAGALIHIRTHVPELCVAPFTRSLKYGTTRNPWNRLISCGGSSGGSGVALAAGMTTLASASDIAGSARIPAAYNGVVGLKPSYGRVPEGAYEFAMNTYNHNSVMARSVADCALMFNVVNGPHPLDPATVKPKIDVPLAWPDVKGLRVALSLDLGFHTNVDPEIVRNTLHAAQCLRDQGAIVEEIDIGWAKTVPETFTIGLGFLMARGMRELIRGAEDQVSDFILDTVETLADYTPEDYMRSQEESARLHHQLQAVFERYDILLCPTMARNDMPAEGSREAHGWLLSHAMTYPFNILSRHPVLSVPSGFTANGLPSAVQIVAPTFCEEQVFRVGAALELAIGWLQRRPQL